MCCRLLGCFILVSILSFRDVFVLHKNSWRSYCTSLYSDMICFNVIQSHQLIFL
jgi:hypothetical protein